MGYVNAKDEQIRIGNALIDNDHLHLSNLVSDLVGAMKQDLNQRVIAKLSDELIGFAQEHFEQEEELMWRIQYSDFAVHKLAHDKLIEELLEFQARLAKEDSIMIVQVSKFLNDWLNQHIHRHDKMLGAAIAKADGEKS